MKGAIMMLRALGVQISDADAEALSAIIPTIPARLVQAEREISSALKRYDERLAAIEKKVGIMEWQG